MEFSEIEMDAKAKTFLASLQGNWDGPPYEKNLKTSKKQIKSEYEQYFSLKHTFQITHILIN